ncbi:MAG: hypothetical protein U0414_25395 [Polyangiaceae bacterium]
MSGSCYATEDSCGLPATCEMADHLRWRGRTVFGDDVRVDACPGDAECYTKGGPGANGGTFSTTCVTKATCTAKTA